MTARPATQHERVRVVMESGRWLALPEIAAATMERWGALDSEAAISARLRDLRKVGRVVECRKRGAGALREYRLEPLRVMGQQLSLL